MKALGLIQRLAVVGRIISKIVFIVCCVVCGCCIVGVIANIVVPDGIQLGSLTLRGLIDNSDKLTIGTSYTAMAMGFISCGCTAVLAKVAERYFKNEIAAGTPFTYEGAKEMKRWGILTLCISIGASIVMGIVYAVMVLTLKDVGEVDFGNGFNIGLGIAIIVMSLICQHGAEVMELSASEDEEE